MSSTASLEIQGALGRRVNVAVASAYTDSQLGGTLAARRYGTSLASARVQVAVGRFLAVQAQGFFYHYDLAAGVWLVEKTIPRVDRRGLQVGVILWAGAQRG